MPAVAGGVRVRREVRSDGGGGGSAESTAAGAGLRTTLAVPATTAEAALALAVTPAAAAAPLAGVACGRRWSVAESLLLLGRGFFFFESRREREGKNEKKNASECCDSGPIRCNQPSPEGLIESADPLLSKKRRESRGLDTP